MTGREVILKIAAEFVSPSDAERIATGVDALGYVCVPRKATSEMIAEAWECELAEDSAAVWESMIETSERVTIEGIPLGRG